ncbi:hypothetical protein DFH09DRAFT_1113023 [Mycena vulgaris]|nr:hypothetical protein DFH09DRAFT_1113023 [Mycena vulgaris]
MFVLRPKQTLLELKLCDHHMRQAQRCARLRGVFPTMATFGGVSGSTKATGGWGGSPTKVMSVHGCSPTKTMYRHSASPTKTMCGHGAVLTKQYFIKRDGAPVTGVKRGVGWARGEQLRDAGSGRDEWESGGHCNTKTHYTAISIEPESLLQLCFLLHVLPGYLLRVAKAESAITLCHDNVMAIVRLQIKDLASGNLEMAPGSGVARDWFDPVSRGTQLSVVEQ